MSESHRDRRGLAGLLAGSDADAALDGPDVYVAADADTEVYHTRECAYCPAAPHRDTRRRALVDVQGYRECRQCAQGGDSDA